MSIGTDPAVTAGSAPTLSRRPRTPHVDGGTSSVPAVVRRAVGVLTTGLVIISVAALLFLAVGPRIFGYQTSTMLTGSMSPLINPGDVVVTVPVPVSDIRAGDIITYRIPVEDRRVETHRVTKVFTAADGSTAVRTKGDANNGVDPWEASLNGKTVHRHVFTVPALGHAVRALREPVVLNSLMYGAPAILVLGVLRSIWRREPALSTGKNG
ncbi:signal peptidase I [Pseudarthrobacter sp. NPDC092419]|uniref:signal peptidase I n=1 Tax=Pseudarthrobacter sp. NPDC092419 TaxID=3364414 RepID=UPI003803CE94